MILEFIDVSYKIPNGEYLYKNLNFKLFKGEYYGILGKNGAGKSTFIEMIMGMRKLESGKIVVFGEDPSESSRTQKHRIFILTHDMLIPGNIRVKDLLNYYKFFYKNYSNQIESELLELFEIDPKKKFGSLSTGQKIKALLSAAFASRAEFYLFDEVTAVLDPKSRINFFNYLKKFRNEHECSVLLATNIVEDLVQSVNKVIFIDENHNTQMRDISDVDELFDISESSAA